MGDFLFVREVPLRKGRYHVKYIDEVLYFFTLTDLMDDSITYSACQPRLEMGCARSMRLSNLPDMLVWKWGRMPGGNLPSIMLSKIWTGDMLMVHF